MEQNGCACPQEKTKASHFLSSLSHFDPRWSSDDNKSLITVISYIPARHFDSVMSYKTNIRCITYSGGTISRVGVLSPSSSILQNGISRRSHGWRLCDEHFSIKTPRQPIHFRVMTVRLILYSLCIKNSDCHIVRSIIMVMCTLYAWQKLTVAIHWCFISRPNIVKS